MTEQNQRTHDDARRRRNITVTVLVLIVLMILGAVIGVLNILWGGPVQPPVTPTPVPDTALFVPGAAALLARIV